MGALVSPAASAAEIEVQHGAGYAVRSGESAASAAEIAEQIQRARLQPPRFDSRRLKPLSLVAPSLSRRLKPLSVGGTVSISAAKAGCAAWRVSNSTVDPYFVAR